MRIAIIGAGLGGLCLAQGLIRAGISVDVYERDASAEFRDQGYRVSLKETGARALHDCLPPHLFELCVATSIRTANRMVFMDSQLRPAFARPLPVAEPGLAGFGVNRLTLREILLAGLDSRVHFGKSLVRYGSVDGSVVAHFDDGTTATADLLVGADGTNSAVRSQLVPSAELDVLHWAIYGRTPLRDDLLAELPDVLVDSFNRVSGDGEAGFAVATCRPHEPAPAAAARLAPGVVLTDIPPYFQWIVRVPAFVYGGESPAELHRLACDLVRYWHPAVGRVLAESDVDSTFPVCVSSARVVQAWDSPNVTLLGDAIHTMSPGRGDGANIALRDAQVLTASLTRAAGGSVSLLQAKQSYETQMLAYGFAAVQASLQHPFAPRVRNGTLQADSAEEGPPPNMAPASGWDGFVAAYQIGDVVEAVVTGRLPMGAFVEVAGVAGILVGAKPEPGSRVSARIKDIDRTNRRFSLVAS